MVMVGLAVDQVLDRLDRLDLSACRAVRACINQRHRASLTRFITPPCLYNTLLTAIHIPIPIGHSRHRFRRRRRGRVNRSRGKVDNRGKDKDKHEEGAGGEVRRRMGRVRLSCQSCISELLVARSTPSLPSHHSITAQSCLTLASRLCGS